MSGHMASRPRASGGRRFRVRRTLGLLGPAVVVGAALWLVPDAGRGDDPGLEAVLERYVEEASRTVGAAVAIVTPMGVEMATAGRARGREAPTDATRFEIGSITKVFTSILLAQLAEEGVVSLTTTVGELVPPRVTLDAEVAGITLTELSTHTSGLPRLPGGTAFLRFMLRPSDPYRGTTVEDLLGTLGQLEGADLETRGRWAYSNFGPALLGRLLEEAAGEPYEVLLRERVLLPMGLEETGFPAFRPGELGEGPTAQGHRQNLRPTTNWQLDAYAPAGGLVSSLSDLVAFVQAVMVAEEGPLAVSTTAAWQPPDGSRGMGLGWVLEERDGERVVWHNGRTGGGYAFVGYLPDARRAVVVLANTSHHGDPFAMGLLLGDASVGASHAGWGARLLTLGLVLLSPLALLVFTMRAAHPVEIGRTRVGRIHLLDATVVAALFLALAWRIGAWQVLPGWIWWLGAGAAGAALLLAGKHGSKLPWFLARHGAWTGAGNRRTVLSAVVLAWALGWVLFRL